MSKDPAFLFYYQDFLVGTDHMTKEQVGMYMYCLCHQAHSTSVRPDHMSSICSTHDNLEVVRKKFVVDSDGKLFNIRLRDTIDKRKKYTESRRQNRLGNISKTYVPHMENENIDEIKVFNKLLLGSFESIWDRYPKKDGKKDAFKHYKSSIKNQSDIDLINKALDRYLAHAQDKDPQFIKLGKTWFYNWEDWVNYEDPLTPEDRKQLSKTERQVKEFESNVK